MFRTLGNQLGSLTIHLFASRTNITSSKKTTAGSRIQLPRQWMLSWHLGHKSDHVYTYIQYDRESYDQDSRSSRVSLSCSSNLASLLCSLEQCEDPLVIEGRILFFPSRLAYLRQGFTEQDVSDWVTSLLLQSWRETLTRHITQPE